MYDFIYIVLFYVARRKRSISYSKLWASGFLAIAIEIHLSMLYQIARLVLDLPFVPPTGSSFVRKWESAPYVLPFMIALYLLYRRRHDKIMEKYKGRKMLTMKNVLILIALYIIPLILGIVIQKIYIGIQFSKM